MIKLINKLFLSLFLNLFKVYILNKSFDNKLNLYFNISLILLKLL